jgi:NAD(P)-dependent dehydrogenase (short-subunit alcohol dehydrogenase family)
VALITGGSRGIGLGIAISLAAEGWQLAINGMRPASEVETVLARLQEQGAEVLYCQADIGNAQDRQRLLQQVREHFGRLNLLVNNAGITSVGRKDLLEADEASWDRVFDTNLKGPFFLTQQVARWMIEQQAAATATSRPFAGTIINVSSISAEMVSTNRGDYCLSKAALGMATKLWATRLAEAGINVYEVQPGVIRSDMTAGVTEKYNRLIAAGLTREPRWGEPADVGRAVALLARGELTYATGQVLYIDGGMRIRTL